MKFSNGTLLSIAYACGKVNTCTTEPIASMAASPSLTLNVSFSTWLELISINTGQAEP